MAARFTAGQLGLMGFTPDGSRGGPVAEPRLDPDGFALLDVTYRGPIVGWQRPRTGSKGRAVFHNSESHQDALASWQLLYRRAWTPGVPPLDFSLQLLLEIRYPVPGSWSKKRQADALARRIRPGRRPDVSNIIKLIEDAGNKLVWDDDAQFDSYVIERIYSVDAPAIWLRVRRAPLTLPWESAA